MKTKIKPATAATPTTQQNETVCSLDPKKVIVSKLNTRQPTAKEVTELMASIQASGQISPAIVRAHATKPDHYELAAGARRKVACEALKIPLLAIVRDIADGEFEDMILTDNLQRVDPDPMQETLLIERRLAAGVPASEIAARYGKSETWIRRRMKLAALTPDAREQWNPDGAFSHFTVEMMEFIGTLPPADQDFMADNAWDNREFGSLAQLLAAHRNRAKDLDKVTWLNDPASFIEKCGPGCATNSAESLFPDPDHPCGQCTNNECFNKRRQKFEDSKLTAVLAGDPVTDFTLFKSKGYANQTTLDGATLTVLPEWQFKEHYTKVTKNTPGTKPAIDLADPLNPVRCFLKPKTDAKGKATAPAADSAKKKESREDRHTGKRLAHLNQQLHAHLSETPDPAADVPILAIVAAFGTSSSRPTCTHQRAHDEAWNSLDGDGTKVSGLHYGCKPNTRGQILWESVIPLLKGRLTFRVNNELLPKWKQAEMKRIATLTGFNHEAAWLEICNKTCPVPKSWGPGLDPVTLKPAAKTTEAIAEVRNRSKVAAAKKTAKKPTKAA